jgi:hypothetical protein
MRRRFGRQVADAQRPITEQLAVLTAQIAREKGVEIAPLQAILVKLGEAGVADYEIPTPMRQNSLPTKLVSIICNGPIRRRRKNTLKPRPWSGHLIERRSGSIY